MEKMKGAVIALSFVALAQVIAWYGADNRGGADNRVGYILQSTDCK